MKRVTRRLNQPHPAHTDPRIYMRTITIISLVVFFILYVIRPFDWSRVESGDLLITALVSSIATFIGMTLFYLWRYLFPAFFAESNWTIGKEVLLVLYQFTVVALAVWSAREYCGQYWYVPQRSYLFTWWVVCSTGVIPYLLATSLKVIYQFRRYLSEAMAANVCLEESQEPVVDGPLLLPRNLGMLSGFLYAESVENYVEVYWSVGGEVKKERYRCTLLELEECNPRSSVFRSHRAFIVNLSKILHVHGNASGFQLVIHPNLPNVPVSRSYVTAFRQRMAGNRLLLA